MHVAPRTGRCCRRGRGQRYCNTCAVKIDKERVLFTRTDRSYRYTPDVTVPIPQTESPGFWALSRPEQEAFMRERALAELARESSS
jgi:hypothetical protein